MGRVDSCGWGAGSGCDSGCDCGCDCDCDCDCESDCDSGCGMARVGLLFTLLLALAPPAPLPLSAPLTPLPLSRAPTALRRGEVRPFLARRCARRAAASAMLITGVVAVEVGGDAVIPAGVVVARAWAWAGVGVGVGVKE